MLRLLVTRRQTDAVEAALTDAFDTTIRDDEAPLTSTEAAQAMRDFDLILPTLGDKFDADAFTGSDLRCKLLANFGVGYNHIDTKAAEAAGVMVSNTPGVVTDATADIALTLLLMTARRAPEGEALVRSGKWTGWQPTQLLGSHVTGAVVGIVGMGRIGQAIGKRCHYGFDMDVRFFNRSPKSDVGFRATQVPDLDDLMAQVDFVVIAVPGGTDTRGMIGAGQISRMKPSAHLINIARGDVVDEKALIAALQHGQIAGAGLDVYAAEPVVPQALRDLPNVALLPHLGTAAESVRTHMGMRALANLKAAADGSPPPDRVA